MKVSNCCGAPNRSVGEDGPDWEDTGICPECRDHCIFEEEEEEEEPEDWPKDFFEEE
jgi:hypothetical protein